jgi:hypothetical protein
MKWLRMNEPFVQFLLSRQSESCITCSESRKVPLLNAAGESERAELSSGEVRGFQRGKSRQENKRARFKASEKQNFHRSESELTIARFVSSRESIRSAYHNVDQPN